MGQKVSRTDFEWVYTDEPHATRRKEILKKYPEIKKLMGYDASLKYIALIMMLFQFTACFFVKDFSWPVVFVLAYFIGGSINHSLTLAIHEISHNLAFGNAHPWKNRFFEIFVNLPIMIPYSAAFKKYHMDHHRYQGDDQLDLDIPSLLETRLFANTFTKLIWLFLQPLFYALRPILTRPKPLTLLEAVNLCSQLSFDVLLYHYLGAKPVFYLLGGALMAMGIHPMAGHFISEHYMFAKGYETYSYYGVLNKVTFNVGYHMEHHDFPSVPGSKLHLVRAIAKEYYEDLPCHTSWCKVLYDFVFDPDIGPFARIKRPSILDQEGHDSKQNCCPKKEKCEDGPNGLPPIGNGDIFKSQ
ncbi:unnamed protein product [Gordionus sp. m RMFG-2023]|uniref:sphingolipid delta(4)-desaturase DES1-like n=1 Tax=Gordionus sp. m RMFG-2023 TaxID=3053472 RepID=UPI0030E373C2